MRLRIKKKSWRVGIIGLYILFLSALERNSIPLLRPAISYSDEIFTIVAMVYLAYNISRNNRWRRELMIPFAIWGGIMIIGIFSSLVYNIQPIIPTLIDALVCSKFFAVYMACYLYSGKQLSKNYVLRYNFLCRFIILLLFILDIVNIFVFEIFPHFDFRNFMFSQALFFRHPSDLADVAFYLLVILFVNSKKKKNFIYMVMASFLVVTTMRNRQIAAVAFVWFINLYMVKAKIKSRVLMALIGTAIAIFIAYDALIMYYFGADIGKTARGAMLLKGIEIARDFFPLGSGFATYGSGMSATYYSPLYYTYGLYNIYGLGGKMSSFINDSFWPIILGQFGWFGVILTIGLFAFLTKKAFCIHNDVYLFSVAVSTVAYLAISSLGTTCIFGTSAVFGAMLLAYFFSQSDMDLEAQKKDGINYQHN